MCTVDKLHILKLESAMYTSSTETVLAVYCNKAVLSYKSVSVDGFSLYSKYAR